MHWILRNIVIYAIILYECICAQTYHELMQMSILHSANLHEERNEIEIEFKFGVSIDETKRKPIHVHLQLSSLKNLCMVGFFLA